MSKLNFVSQLNKYILYISRIISFDDILCLALMFQIKNQHNTEEHGDVDNNNMQSCLKNMEVVQCKLNEAVLEKEKLQRQLNYAVDYIECTIKKHKTLTCKLNDNYDELWNKYQKKIMELNENKNVKKCLIDENDDLNRKYKTLECNLREYDKKNENLESINDKLNLCLNDKKQEIESLMEYNKCERNMLEKSQKELNRTIIELEEKTDELNKEKEKNSILKSKTKSLRCELSQKNEEIKSEINCLKNSNESFKTELETLKRRNEKLTQELCVEKTENEKLAEMLKKCEDKNETLKQTMKNEDIQRNDYNCQLNTEIMNVQNEMNELKEKYEKQTEEVKMLEKTNGDLRSRVDELQCRLETVVKSADDKCKLLTENIECMERDKNKLENDLMCKNRVISELEERLCEAKQMYMRETENASELITQLENFKYKENIMPGITRQCSDDNSNCQMDCKFLDELRSDCESLTARIKENKSFAIENSEEKCQMFENVITKCNSLANYFIN